MAPYGQTHLLRRFKSTSYSPCEISSIPLRLQWDVDLIWAINLPHNSLHRGWTFNWGLNNLITVTPHAAGVVQRHLLCFTGLVNVVFNQLVRHPGHQTLLQLLQHVRVLMCHYIIVLLLNLNSHLHKKLIGPVAFHYTRVIWHRMKR